MNDHTTHIYGITRTAPKSQRNHRRGDLRSPSPYLRISAITLAITLAALTAITLLSK